MAIRQAANSLSGWKKHRAKHACSSDHAAELENPIAYLAAKAAGLGILKRKRKKRVSPAELAYLIILENP
jgi:hypothetical protein